MQRSFTITGAKEHFEAIFFKNDAYDLLKSPATSRAWRGFLWVFAFAFVFILYGTSQPNSAGVLGIAATVLIGQTIITGLTVYNLWKERQKVIDFAKRSAGPATLLTSYEGFCHTHKGIDHIERWANVQGASIGDDHIHVQATGLYTFPKRSMTEGDFTELVAIIRRHTLQGKAEDGNSNSEQSPIGFRQP